ncbi:hypothetical protein XA68_14258 [Ophiocordyceps unilateralis]|uniref:Uncharacterized protein n=1 Tax=Ophiocordyceps unilateralis TaxID=268505 RepID=A0A2A9PB19_OPHUN|nr:hypothetical protein XA68_14258 [Ophiocordyceps unilateralis]
MMTIFKSSDSKVVHGGQACGTNVNSWAWSNKYPRFHCKTKLGGLHCDKVLPYQMPYQMDDEIYDMAFKTGILPRENQRDRTPKVGKRFGI